MMLDDDGDARERRELERLRAGNPQEANSQERVIRIDNYSLKTACDQLRRVTEKNRLTDDD